MADDANTPKRDEDAVDVRAVLAEARGIAEEMLRDNEDPDSAESLGNHIRRIHALLSVAERPQDAPMSTEHPQDWIDRAITAAESEPTETMYGGAYELHVTERSGVVVTMRHVDDTPCWTIDEARAVVERHAAMVREHAPRSEPAASGDCLGCLGTGEPHTCRMSGEAPNNTDRGMGDEGFGEPAAGERGEVESEVSRRVAARLEDIAAAFDAEADGLDANDELDGVVVISYRKMAQTLTVIAGRERGAALQPKGSDNNGG